MELLIQPFIMQCSVGQSFKLYLYMRKREREREQTGEIKSSDLSYTNSMVYQQHVIGHL